MSVPEVLFQSPPQGTTLSPEKLQGSLADFRRDRDDSNRLKVYFSGGKYIGPPEHPSENLFIRSSFLELT